jgi:NADPH-ferrihemoprotein reductase
VLKALAEDGSLRPSTVVTVAAVAPASQLPAHLQPATFSLGLALGRRLDLAAAPQRKSVLRMLAAHCTDPSHARTLTYWTARAGREAYAHEVLEHQPSLLDLLLRFPSCKPPLAALLAAVPPLAPRLYSISNAHVAAGDAVSTGVERVHVALSVVRFGTRYGTRRGVASCWLDRVAVPLLANSAAGVSAPPPLLLPVFLKRCVANPSCLPHTTTMTARLFVLPVDDVPVLLLLVVVVAHWVFFFAGRSFSSHPPT